MSLNQKNTPFSKRAPALVAAFVMAAGGAVGGAKVSYALRQPLPSPYAVAPQGENNMADMQKRLTQMENMKRDIWRLNTDIAAAKAHVDEAIIETDTRDIISSFEREKQGKEEKLLEEVESFAVTLRQTAAVSEKEYIRLLEEYDARIGIAFPARLGNFREGAVWRDECYSTDPAKIGPCMQSRTKNFSVIDATTALTGGLMGGILGLGLAGALRQKKPAPKV